MPTFDFTAPDGTTHSIDGPEGATREQAFHMLQLKLGGAAQPAAPQAPKGNPEADSSTGNDYIDSAQAGLAHGAATALGLPGDIASLAHSVAPQGVIDAVKSIPGAKALYSHLPGSQAILDSSTNPVVNYEPKSAGARYTKAVLSNAAPGLVTGMGVLPTVAGAVTGQAAYDATGSHIAEALGNVGGSIAAPLALARYGARLGLSSRQALMPLHDEAQVKAAANAGYADPLIRDTTVTPQAAQNVAGDMQSALANARSRFAPEEAPKVATAIEGLGDRAPSSGFGPPAPVSVEDLHLLRKRLGNIGRETQDFKPTEQAVAAGTAKRVLDRYLDNIPSRDVARGNPIDAVDALRTANGNWRASANAGDVGDLIGNAIESNASKNSAMNLGNTLRQTFLPLLKNDAAKLRGMGHGDDVIDAVRQVTQGDFATNALRRASNMLGGGGGIASTLIGHGIASGAGGAAGYEEGGLPGMVAGTVLGAAPGQLLRVAANSRTLAAARRVQEQLLARAPVNAGIVARNNAARAANAQLYSNVVGRSGIPNALLQATRVNRIYVGPKRSDDN